MKRAPVYLTTVQLLDVLDDIRERVSAGDSFEGSIEYLMPDEDDPADGFRVQGAYRVGNSQGQGGMRMIGELR